MDASVDQVYDNNSENELWILFDHSGRGGVSRLWKERRAWGASAKIESIGHGRTILIIKPGGARRLAK